MSSHDERFDPTRPALVLLHGETNRKYRALDREALIVGRARGCDLGLDAPDISNLHCVITRTLTGFQIRDCGSRAGTKVNGSAVREAALVDGDLLQLGPFCFRVHLPEMPAYAEAATPANSQQPRNHVQRSRRKLAQLALGLRRRLRAQQAGTADFASMKARIQDRETSFAARQLEVEARARQLTDLEQQLKRQRELLDREHASIREKVARQEQELALHRARAEEDIARQLREFEDRLRHDAARLQEERQRISTTQKEAEQQLKLESERLAKERHELEIALAELERARGQQPAPAVFAPLDKVLHEIQLDQRESLMTQKNWAKEQSELNNRLAEQGAAIQQTEQAVRQQQELMARMMAELKLLQGASRLSNGSEDDIVRENAQLRQENEQLTQKVAELKRATMEAKIHIHPDPALEKQVVDLRHEVTLLQQLLDEKNQLLDELRKRAVECPPEAMDAASYEAELVEFRRQLEADRTKLNAEIEQLRTRNKELDEATRELELEMSRERAEMARERQRLERLRDEMRLETERVQRQDQSMRERLAPVQRLRDEFSVKQPPGATGS